MAYADIPMFAVPASMLSYLMLFLLSFPSFFLSSSLFFFFHSLFHTVGSFPRLARKVSIWWSGKKSRESSTRVRGARKEGEPPPLAVAPPVRSFSRASRLSP